MPTREAITVPSRIDQSTILRFYRGVDEVRKLHFFFSFNELTLVNMDGGLGDSISLTDLPRSAAFHNREVTVHSSSPFFKAVMKFNPYYKFAVSSFLVSTHFVQMYDLGGGHVIQRFQRAYGFSTDARPRGCIEVPNARMTPGRMVLHFEPSSFVVDQRGAGIHPRPREVYPENMAIIQCFVRRHPEMHFCEVGCKSSGLRGVDDWTGLSMEETIERMASCEYFVGVNSGPLHVAAALGLKLITIINFPDPTKIYLPLLKDIGLVDSQWLYPQSVLLHEDGQGELVARFSLENLERAMNGELYPYWSDQYLPLIYEKL